MSNAEPNQLLLLSEQRNVQLGNRFDFFFPSPVIAAFLALATVQPVQNIMAVTPPAKQRRRKRSPLGKLASLFSDEPLSALAAAYPYKLGHEQRVPTAGAPAWMGGQWVRGSDTHSCSNCTYFENLYLAFSYRAYKNRLRLFA
jgi:hypothetical protein